MNNKILIAATVAICAFVIAGGVLIYGVHYDYDANASINGDGTVDYSLTSSTASECSCVLLSGVDVKTHTYLYLDEKYASFYPVSTQKTFLKTLKDVFEKRGYRNVEYVDANQLKNVLESANACDSMIVFTSGSLPDTVFSSGPKSLISWLDNGGAVYWCGPNIGSKMSTRDKVVDTEYGLLTGKVSDGTSKQEVKYASEYSLKMHFSFKQCTYGLKKDCENSLILGYTGEDYSSASVVKYSNGRIFVIGGDITSVVDATIYTCADIAGTVMCGITENTKILAAKEFHKDGGSMTGKMDCHAEHGNILYVMFGVPYSTWSKAIML